MERVKAHGFLSKTQAFLCFSPFVCPLLHRELITPNGYEQLCLWPSNDCFMAVSRAVHRQSFNDHKQGCSWPLGVTNSKAFTDEVRSPRLLRTRCKRIVQQLKRHQTPLFIVGQTRKCRKTTLTDLCNPRAVLY